MAEGKSTQIQPPPPKKKESPQQLQIYAFPKEKKEYHKGTGWRGEVLYIY